MTLGNGLERSYSLLNDPTETHRYVLAVLREADSRGGSTFVHDHLREGDRLASTAPINNFPINEAGETHILIAGGIGITPLKSMTHRLSARGANFTLHYCARDRERAAYLDELTAALGERLHVHLDGGDPSRGLDVAALLSKRAVRRPRLCVRTRRADPRGARGGARLAEGHRALRTVPRHRGRRGAAPTDQPFEITLARAGKTLTVPADKSILEVLRANGFKIKTLCKEGVCGTCRVGLLSGKADHRDEVLTDEQREHEIQVCVSRALPNETLVLDL